MAIFIRPTAADGRRWRKMARDEAALMQRRAEYDARQAARVLDAAKDSVLAAEQRRDYAEQALRSAEFVAAISAAQRVRA